MQSDELRRRFERALRRNDTEELPERVLQVAREAPDREWAEWCCTRLAKHRNAGVRGSALLGFGHLAQRFGHLDRRRVHRLVQNALYAPDEIVRSHAESAAGDLETHLRWDFDRP